MHNDTPIEIYDDGPTHWVASEWIGRGLKYPSSNTPQVVLDARQQLLTLPRQDLLPTPSTSVLMLLSTTFPPQMPSLVVPNIDTLFSHLPPTEPLSALMIRPLPPSHCLQLMNSHVGQAWFDGKQSIIDWRYKDSRFPLSALTYWLQVERTSKILAVWQAADLWLKTWGGEDTSGAEEARDGLASLPWDEEYQALDMVGMRMETLGIMLSDEWWSDEHIDMCVTYLAQRVHVDPLLSETTVVARLRFMQEVEAAARQKAYGRDACSFLKHYKALFLEHGCKRLLFPVHMNGNHWIAMEIDFCKKTIRHGTIAASTLNYALMMYR